MANNLYGYNDYNGPTTGDQATASLNGSDEEEDDPLRVAQWIEGDSLAPPCGSSLSIVHSLLDLAFESVMQGNDLNNNDEEVLYDLGCGDGRVCLEAYWRYYKTKDDGKNGNNREMQCVGVEIEEDLVVRFRELIEKLPPISPPGEKVDNVIQGNVKTLNHSPKIHAVQGDLLEILTFLMDRQKKEFKTTVGNTKTNASAELEVLPYDDLPLPTIITFYLLPDAIRLIEPKLIEMMKLNPFLRIVCNTWGMQNKSIKPVKTVDAIDQETGLSTKLFLYTSDSFSEANK